MSYIVVYQRADGSSGVEECVDLDLAIVTAERLRNVDAVERPRIFQTEEIRYDFKPYYRVEVASEGAAHAADDSGLVNAGAAPSSSGALLSESIEPAAPVADTSDPLADLGRSDFSADSSGEESALTHDLFKTDVPAAEDLTPPEVPSADSGLFGAADDAADTADISDVMEEASASVDADPPRRGLFGR